MDAAQCRREARRKKEKKRQRFKVFRLKTIHKRVQNRLSMEEPLEGTTCPNGAPPK
ncbi:hypothetical protein KI387_019609, partial [Taxus chinensis]